MDYELKEKSVAKLLAARNLSRLFEFLYKLKESELNDEYKLRWLYAVGGQSVVYLAENKAGKYFIVKLALLPYHRAAYISNSDIYQARANLERESDLLQMFSDSALPNFCDLIYSRNPLYSHIRGHDIIDREPFLIMEFIEGINLLEAARNIHRAPQPDFKSLEWLAWKTADLVINTSILLFNYDEGYLYSDISPINLILIKSIDNPIRILDAGSIIPINPTQNIFPHFTPTYVPQNFYKAHIDKSLLWPDVGYVLYVLGKVLWELLTNKQVYPAEDPNLSIPVFDNYSIQLKDFLIDLIKIRFNDFQQVKQSIEASTDINFSGDVNFEALFTTQKSYNKVNQKSRIKRKFELVKSIEKKAESPQSHTLIKYSPHTQHLIVTSEDTINFLDSKNLDLIDSISLPSPSNLLKSEKVESLAEKKVMSTNSLPIIMSLDIDDAGKRLVTLDHTNRMCLWDIENNFLVWECRDKKITGIVKISSDGNTVAALSKQGGMVYIPPRLQPVTIFNGIVDRCACLTLDQNDPYIFIGGWGSISMWDLISEDEIGQIKIVGKLVWKVSVINDGQAIAALTSNIQFPRDYSIIIWEKATQKKLTQIAVPTNRVSELIWDKNQQLAFISGYDGYLGVLNGESLINYGDIVKGQGITALDFNLENQILAISQTNGIITTFFIDII